jgi:hypothetical protein
MGDFDLPEHEPLKMPQVGDSVPVFQAPGTPGNPIFKPEDLAPHPWQTPQVSTDTGLPKAPLPAIDPTRDPPPLSEDIPSSVGKKEGGIVSKVNDLLQGDTQLGKSDWKLGVKPEGIPPSQSKDDAQIGSKDDLDKSKQQPIGADLPKPAYMESFKYMF